MHRFVIVALAATLFAAPAVARSGGGGAGMGAGTGGAGGGHGGGSPGASAAPGAASSSAAGTNAGNPTVAVICPGMLQPNDARWQLRECGGTR